MLGATGAIVSTVTLSAVEAAPVLPATVSVAAKICVPFVKAAVARLQAPLAFAVAVPSSVAPSYTFTVLFATAVPVSVRTFTLVMPSPTVPLSGENEVMLGAAGAGGLDVWLVFPATSTAVTVKTVAAVPNLTKLQ